LTKGLEIAGLIRHVKEYLYIASTLKSLVNLYQQGSFDVMMD